MSSSGVRFDHVSHRFGDVAVIDDLSLDVAPGEFVSIVGQSGCGKSTLLRILAGLVIPTSGVVTGGGLGSVAHLPQGDSLLPWKRALDNAALGLQVSGVSRADARTAAHELFETFGLAGFERSWPHELSGGMSQRIAVLRTFLLNQPVLCLDEPFGALDALTRRVIQGWLREVWLRDKRTTLLVTHDVEEALLLSDRVVVMSQRPGRIVKIFDVELDDGKLRDETSAAFTALKRQILDALFHGTT